LPRNTSKFIPPNPPRTSKDGFFFGGVGVFGGVKCNARCVRWRSDTTHQAVAPRRPTLCLGRHRSHSPTRPKTGKGEVFFGGVGVFGGSELGAFGGPANDIPVGGFSTLGGLNRGAFSGAENELLLVAERVGGLDT
jgi:hypothetical protein